MNYSPDHSYVNVSDLHQGFSFPVNGIDLNFVCARPENFSNLESAV
jgi:hypothetical protein